MKNYSGNLAMDRMTGGAFGEPVHRQLIYDFPVSSSLKDGVYSAWFMETKRSMCYKYVLWYTSDSFRSRVIQDIEKSGFVKIANKSIWKKSDIQMEVNDI